MYQPVIPISGASQSPTMMTPNLAPWTSTQNARSRRCWELMVATYRRGVVRPCHDRSRNSPAWSQEPGDGGGPAVPRRYGVVMSPAAVAVERYVLQPPAYDVVWSSAALAAVVLMLVVLVQMVRLPHLTVPPAVLWLRVVLALPVIGPLVRLAIQRPAIGPGDAGHEDVAAGGRR